MRKAKQILENLKQYEAQGQDEANEMYWKAQDIVDKLQEHIKNGYVEDFYNLLYRIVACIKHDRIDPRKLINDIQDNANAFAEETNKDDKEWLKSDIDDNIHSLEIFNNLIKEKING